LVKVRPHVEVCLYDVRIANIAYWVVSLKKFNGGVRAQNLYTGSLRASRYQGPLRSNHTLRTGGPKPNVSKLLPGCAGVEVNFASTGFHPHVAYIGEVGLVFLVVDKSWSNSFVEKIKAVCNGAGCRLDKNFVVGLHPKTECLKNLSRLYLKICG
jgi:hypothetical protein